MQKRLGITLRPLNMKRLRRRGGADQGALQRGVGEELGIHPHDRPRDRPPRRAVQAGGRFPNSCPSPRRTGRSIGFGLVPARPQRRSSGGNRSGRLTPALLADLLWPLKTRAAPPAAASCCWASFPSGAARGVDAMLYHWIWTKAGGARDLLGRGGLDPRGQPRHERGPREDGLHASTRPTGSTIDRYEGAGDRRAPASSAATSSRPCSRRGARGHGAGALARQGGAARRSSGVRLVARRPRTIDAALREAAPGQDVDRTTWPAWWRRGTRPSSSGPTARAPPTCSPRRDRPSAAEPPRFVLVSSMAAGGPSTPGRPLRGDEPPRPVTAYGRSKLAGRSGACAAAGSPGPSSGRRWSTAPANRGPQGLPARPHAGSRRCSATGPRNSPRSTAPTSPRRSSPPRRPSAQSGRTYYACHPEIFTSAPSCSPSAGSVLPPGSRRVRVLPLPVWLARGALTITGAAARLAGQATILTPDKANEFFQPAWTGDPAPLMRDTGWRPTHELEPGWPPRAAWYREQGLAVTGAAGPRRGCCSHTSVVHLGPRAFARLSAPAGGRLGARSPICLYRPGDLLAAAAPDSGALGTWPARDLSSDPARCAVPGDRHPEQLRRRSGPRPRSTSLGARSSSAATSAAPGGRPSPSPFWSTVLHGGLLRLLSDRPGPPARLSLAGADARCPTGRALADRHLSRLLPASSCSSRWPGPYYEFPRPGPPGSSTMPRHDWSTRRWPGQRLRRRVSVVACGRHAGRDGRRVPGIAVCWAGCCCVPACSC